MNWLDILISCVLLLLVINGIRKGFILSFATLVALVLGIWVAVHYSGYISGFLVRTFHPSGTWLTVLSYVITFLLVVTGVIILAKLLEKVVKTAGLGLANRLVGGLFGLIKGVLGVSALLFILVTFDPKGNLINQKTREKSFTYKYVEMTFPLYSRVLIK
jgi:membrane protein required for colicin V production